MDEARTKLPAARACVVHPQAARFRRPRAGCSGATAAPRSHPTTPGSLTIGTSAEGNTLVLRRSEAGQPLSPRAAPHAERRRGHRSRQPQRDVARSTCQHRARDRPSRALGSASATPRSTPIVDAGSARSRRRSADDRRGSPALVGDSDAIRELTRLVHRLARVDSSVLIHGETGSGKEVVARALHEASPRRGGPLIVVDCGSMPRNVDRFAPLRPRTRCVHRRRRTPGRCVRTSRWRHDPARRDRRRAAARGPTGAARRPGAPLVHARRWPSRRSRSTRACSRRRIAISAPRSTPVGFAPTLTTDWRSRAT